MIYTIGHGNRPLEELTGLLRSALVRRLVDVRAFPGSRRHPHFGRGELERSLPGAGIEYVWEGARLGGRRKPRPESPHLALRNAGFRAYADHMESSEFNAGMERVLALAAGSELALMCAERLPWQCHRYLISDWLAARGVEVRHIIDAAAPKAHTLRAEARVVDGALVYDGSSQASLDVG